MIEKRFKLIKTSQKSTLSANRRCDIFVSSKGTQNKQNDRKGRNKTMKNYTELWNMVERVDYSKMTTDEIYTYYSVTVGSGRYINIKRIYNEETANKVFERACEMFPNEMVDLRHTSKMLPVKTYFNNEVR